MSPEAILYPAIPMFFLTAAMLGALARARFKAVGQQVVDPTYYALYQGDGESGQLRLLARHVQNHFEVPPLFYIIVLMHYVTHSVSTLAVALAWAYVASRMVHSVVHLGSNNVQRRFMVFIISGLILCALWINLGVSLLTA